ncbi:MAG: rhodanese-like domain-containing protein [Candidatus Moraniibacteriota bacterium]
MKNKKDTNALLIGLGLIVVVMLITFFRSSFFSTQTASNSKQATDEAQIPGQKFKTLSVSQLQKKISAGEQLNLLDVRKFDEYIAEHIVDAINVPSDEFPASSKINSKNPVILITEDATDQNIEANIKSLQDEHIKDIQVLAGGMVGWKKLAGATVNFGNPKSFVDQSKVSYVENAQLNNAVKENVKMFILDIRTPQEYATGHIKGAVNIPFDELEKRRSEVRPFPRIIVSGANELQEFEASVQLYDMILVQPFILKTGIQGWQKNGFELVK